MPDKRYPVAEIFDSIQGEGLFSGTAMTFIRLAGCHIGGKHGACTFADGRRFSCDTDYRARATLTVEAIVKKARHRHVCITGGEPLDHHLPPLLGALKAAEHVIHLETSGSLECPAGIDWLTVSPKAGCLDSQLSRADQLKLLVDGAFDSAYWQERLARVGSRALVYLQPINDTLAIDEENASRAFDTTQLVPSWRLCLQLHKVLRVR